MATDVILRNVKLRLLRKITLRRNYAHLERNYDVIDNLDVLAAAPPSVAVGVPALALSVARSSLNAGAPSPACLKNPFPIALQEREPLPLHFTDL